MPIILFFFSITNAGGAEKMICQLANTLIDRGFKVFLVSLDKKQSSSFYPLSAKVSWLKLGYKKGIFAKFQRVKELMLVCKKYQIKVFLGFVTSGDKTVYLATKLSGVPLIVAERNAPAMYDIRYTLLQKKVTFFLLRFAKKIVVQFPSYLTKYPKHLQSKIIAIPNPVARVENINSIIHKKTFTILVVSRLDEVQKGLSVLIKAFSNIERSIPDWYLKIIGNGSQKKDLLSLIQKYNLSHKVKIHEVAIDISQEYANADLFVMPSLWEGFPNALAEAMSYGLPVVGFEKAEGVSNLISENGYLAQGLNNEESLATTILEAIKDEQQRKIFGLMAKKHIEQYQSNNQIDKFANLIKSVGDG